MIDKMNGYFRLASIFVVVLGMVLGMFVWASSTFAAKAEVAKEIVYVRNEVSDIKANMREIRMDVKEILKVLN